MATISLTGLRIRGHHGVLDHARATGQIFLVDLQLTLALAQAATTDHVDHTVDCADVGATVDTIITGTPGNLIDPLAVTIADAILADFARITAVEVTVNKPQAPIPADFANVAVTVARNRQSPHG